MNAPSRSASPATGPADVLATLENSLQGLTSAIEAFPWHDRNAYVSWLGNSFEYVNHVTRILSLTGGRLPMRLTKLSNRFIQHAAEEKGHEKLIINDCKAFQLDPATIPVLPEAEAFHKSLYYWIYQGSPTVVLGWAIFLEAVAVRFGQTIFDRVEPVHGKKACSFLRVHIQEDPDHVRQGEEILKSLSGADFEEVCHGIRLYAGLYENMYRALADQASHAVSTGRARSVEHAA